MKIINTIIFINNKSDPRSENENVSGIEKELKIYHIN